VNIERIFVGDMEGLDRVTGTDDRYRPVFVLEEALSDAVSVLPAAELTTPWAECGLGERMTGHGSLIRTGSCGRGFAVRW